MQGKLSEGCLKVETDQLPSDSPTSSRFAALRTIIGQANAATDKRNSLVVGPTTPHKGTDSLTDAAGKLSNQIGREVVSQSGCTIRGKIRRKSDGHQKNF